MPVPNLEFHPQSINGFLVRVWLQDCHHSIQISFLILIQRHTISTSSSIADEKGHRLWGKQARTPNAYLILLTAINLPVEWRQICAIINMWFKLNYSFCFEKQQQPAPKAVYKTKFVGRECTKSRTRTRVGYLCNKGWAGELGAWQVIECYSIRGALAQEAPETKLDKSASSRDYPSLGGLWK